jgi:hypothetical protein
MIEGFLFGLVGFLLAILLLATAVALVVLHRRLARLERRLESRPVERDQPAPVAPPPPLPAASPAQATEVAPDSGDNSLASGLRRLGLLPPETLRGEGALGAWFAVRIGAALALAAVVFLGIWLNLRSSLPAWFRLAEVVALGAAFAAGGHRLARSREDLGRVLLALGLGVLQFAAWAAHGLDRMRVVDSPLVGGVLQVAAASAIGLVAMRLASARLAQLAAWFLLLAGLLAKRADIGALNQALPLVALAALGGLTLWRRAWTQVAWIAAGGVSLLGLLLPNGDPEIAAGAGLAALALLWLSTQALTQRGCWPSERARAGLTFAAVALPSLVIAACVEWTDGAPASLAALAAATLCGLAGIRERRLGGAAGDLLLAAAIVFAGAAGAWALEPRLDWLPLALAAAAAHLLARRGGSSLAEWTCDLLAAAATLQVLFLKPREDLASVLLGIGALALLLGFRSPTLLAKGKLRAILPIAFLALLLLRHMDDSGLPKALHGLVWFLPLIAAAATRSLLPALAAGPVLMLASARIWGWDLYWNQWDEWKLAWAGLLLLVHAGAATQLSRRGPATASRIAAILAGFTLLPVLVHGLALGFEAAFGRECLVGSAEEAKLGLVAWFLTAGTAWASCLGLRQLGAKGGEGLLLVLAIALGAFNPDLNRHSLGSFPLAWAPLWVVSVSLLLGLVARESRELPWTTPFAVAAAAAFLLLGIGATDHLHGYRATVLWLISAGLGFGAGHLFGSRPVRLVAVAFLGLATLKLTLVDISDLVGRIIAFAVAAAAFLGIGWIYSRQSKGPDGAKGEID